MRWALVSMLVLAGCGGVRPNVKPDETRDTSMDGILRLIGRQSAAHACPVTNGVALTSAHVVDPKSEDPDAPLLPFRYSTPEGDEGFVGNAQAEISSDVASIRAHEHPFTRWYQLAKDRPKVGDKVKYMAYDFTKRGRAYAERPRFAVIERIVAGHLVLSVGGPRGSSGSCVLNEANEVVGINSWVHDWSSFDETTGVAVGVWGDWIK